MTAHQHLSLCHHRFFCSSSPASQSGSGGSAFSLLKLRRGSSGRVLAVEEGRFGVTPSSCCLRAPTTRRTSTRAISLVCVNCTRQAYSRANVSSMFTISRALVSMNPYPRFRAHSSPSLAPTCRMPWRSHLFPATKQTGSTCPFDSRSSLS